MRKGSIHIILAVGAALYLVFLAAYLLHGGASEATPKPVVPPEKSLSTEWVRVVKLPQGPSHESPLGQSFMLRPAREARIEFQNGTAVVLNGRGILAGTPTGLDIYGFRGTVSIHRRQGDLEIVVPGGVLTNPTGMIELFTQRNQADIWVSQGRVEWSLSEGIGSGTLAAGDGIRVGRGEFRPLSRSPLRAENTAGEIDPVLSRPLQLEKQVE
jgi:hypothetical protein